MDQPWVYIVLFGLLFIVYAKIMPRSDADKGKPGPSIQEIETTMDHFASELEEQNRILLEQLATTKKEYELQMAKLVAEMDRLEGQQVPMNLELAKLSAAYEELQRNLARQTHTTGAAIMFSNSTEAYVVESLEDDPQQPEDHAMNMKSRYAELFALYDQGKSTDTIAKKLNMTKGEVSLIIQLAKQEEKLHAQ